MCRGGNFLYSIVYSYFQGSPKTSTSMSLQQITTQSSSNSAQSIKKSNPSISKPYKTGQNLLVFAETEADGMMSFGEQICKDKKNVIIQLKIYPQKVFHQYFLQLQRRITNSYAMKSISLGQDLNEFHQKCVCQICSCHKHKCPHSKIHIPHTEITSYQSQYIKHPINTWKKPPPEKAAQYRPYDSINSAYQEHYPGQKPQMREKIVPRVKDQNKKIPFNANTEYDNQFGPKKVNKEKVHIKDNQYVPDTQPFNGSTTYGSFFNKKKPFPNEKPQTPVVNFPQGYKFSPNTTYSNDFNEKKPNINKSFKPVQVIGENGPHDLNTIYRQDFKEKTQPDICPVLKMPKLPSKLEYPSQHLTYNKHSGSWVQK